MTMIEPGGRRSMLGPSVAARAAARPARDSLSATRFTLRRQALPRSRFPRHDASRIADSTRESLADWLATPSADRRARSNASGGWSSPAPSTPISTQIAVPYAAKVIRELFMNSAEAGSHGHEHAFRSANCTAARSSSSKQHGAERPSQRQRRVAPSGMNETQQWIVHTRDRRRSSPSSSSSRCPSKPRRNCCRNLPADRRSEDLARQLERYEHWPICSVHLWFDREITDLDHAVLLDREIHWMYNKIAAAALAQNQRQLSRTGRQRLTRFAALSREEAIEQALRELAEFFPAVEEAKLVKAALIKEVRATFGVPPASTPRAPARSRRGPTASSPATGSQPAGPRRWRAPRAAAILPPKPSAPPESKTAASSNPT